MTKISANGSSYIIMLPLSPLAPPPKRELSDPCANAVEMNIEASFELFGARRPMPPGPATVV